MTQLSPDVLELSSSSVGRSDPTALAEHAGGERSAEARRCSAQRRCCRALAWPAPLGVIDLGDGVSSTPVTSFPQWNGQTWSLAAGGADAPFVYHLTGGHAAGVGCGAGDPDPTNNLYITSARRLTTDELHHISNVVATGLTPNARIAMPGVNSIRNASCAGSVIVPSPGAPGS